MVLILIVGSAAWCGNDDVEDEGDDDNSIIMGRVTVTECLLCVSDSSKAIS